MSQDQPKNALQEAYDLARKNPDKTVILSSSEQGTKFALSDFKPFEDTDKKKLFSSSYNCGY